jgi:ABC-type polysaccharide/polyol phosphate transport system ATPase subunit
MFRSRFQHGEVLGIIGHNGAGKSTLLKTLSRITESTTGKADIYGRVSSLLEVGTGFHSELTGRENIFLNAAMLGMRRAEVQGKFDYHGTGYDPRYVLPVWSIGNFGIRRRLFFSILHRIQRSCARLDQKRRALDRP